MRGTIAQLRGFLAASDAADLELLDEDELEEFLDMLLRLDRAISLSLYGDP
jgi:hypothetical protein